LLAVFDYLAECLTGSDADNDRCSVAVAAKARKQGRA
jgi:hypothetical protein